MFHQLRIIIEESPKKILTRHEMTNYSEQHTSNNAHSLGNKPTGNVLIEGNLSPESEDKATLVEWQSLKINRVKKIIPQK
jgi:hypothetical protein